VLLGASPSSKVIYIESVDQYNNIISKQNQLIVVEFFASWCAPCKRIASLYEKLAEKYDKVVFAKLDIDEHGGLPEVATVTAVPTFKFFKGGTRPIIEMVGANIEKVEALVKQYM
jgi:thioredoxin 1